MLHVLTLVYHHIGNPTVTAIGSIGFNGDGNQCIGQKICAYIGQSVTISCVTNGTDYTIQGPQEIMSLNQPLTFTIGNNDFGIYYCNSSNVCGSVTSTIELENAACKCYTLFISIVYVVSGPIPIIMANLRHSNGSNASACYCNKNDLYMDCNEGSGPLATNISWYINGVLQSNNTNTQQIRQAGNYTCVRQNICGSQTLSTRIIKSNKISYV